MEKDIIETGLKNAAKQLSFFIKEGVELSAIYFDAFSVLSIANDLDDLYLLTTTLVGDLGGVCYLVLNQGETALLRSRALLGIAPESKEYEALKDAILLEIDNILAAAVITHFSNALQTKVHGSVPKLEKISAAGIEKIFKEQLDEKKYSIYFKTQFSNAALNFSPNFIWFLKT